MHRSRSASITIRLLNEEINMGFWMVHELSGWSAVLYKTIIMTFPIDFPHNNNYTYIRLC